jgi:catechol 2,3-dioxygenase-like lactoylglutathione lyase family enzyme
MTTVSVRYIVDDVDAAIAFYTRHLGFAVELHPAPGFAALTRGDLRLLLNAVGGPGGAAQPMPDGRTPEPGGWNRIQLRSRRHRGPGRRPPRRRAPLPQRDRGRDGRPPDPAGGPSGNPVELFEPA